MALRVRGILPTGHRTAVRRSHVLLTDFSLCSLMQELHTDMWNQGESMSDCGTRLMDRMQRIHRLFPHEISADEAPKLLRDRFYHGLPSNCRIFSTSLPEGTAGYL